MTYGSLFELLRTWGSLWELLGEDSKTRQCDGLSGSPGKSLKEGKGDQGTSKQIGRSPLALLHFLGPPGLPSGLLKAFAPQAQTPGGMMG